MITMQQSEPNQLVKLHEAKQPLANSISANDKTNDTGPLDMLSIILEL
jgi:hypothetical protein